MASAARNVLLLVGRMRSTDDGRTIGTILDRLAARGIAAQVLCLSTGPGVQANAQIIPCPALGRRWRRAWAVRQLRFGADLRLPDLIHVLQTELSPIGLALAEHCQVSYVQTIDDYLAAHDRLRVSKRWCRGLIAPSRDLADDLIGQCQVPPGFVSVVNPGIEVNPTAEAVPVPLRRVPVIGTAGPLKEESGFATFLNAARRVLDGGLDAEFVIAGQGADEGNLRRRADRLRIADRVTFAGIPVVGPRFWNVLDVFCQPATVPTVGRTLAMALAFGVPAIAADIAGLRTLVAHGETGLRVPPENTGALATAMLALLKDRDNARRLGRQAQELIRRDFDPATEADHLVEVYGRALAPVGIEQSRAVAAVSGA